MTPKRTAVLISGRGSNLESLAAACRTADMPACIALVISNVAEAPGLARARDAGFATAVVPHRDFATREAFDAALDRQLRQAEIEIICLAGFMRVLGGDFVRAWQGRLINVHPSLLPAFKGIRVHERVLASGVTISGCTVHFVVPELDSGPAVMQAAVPVRRDDTSGSLAARVLEAEHKIYPAALRLVASGRARLEGGRTVFADAGEAEGVLFNPPVG